LKKKPTNPTKFGIIKQQKQMKLGRKKSKLPTPPINIIKKNNQIQPCFIKIQKLIVKNHGRA